MLSLCFAARSWRRRGRRRRRRRARTCGSPRPPSWARAGALAAGGLPACRPPAAGALSPLRPPNSALRPHPADSLLPSPPLPSQCFANAQCSPIHTRLLSVHNFLVRTHVHRRHERLLQEPVPLQGLQRVQLMWRRNEEEIRRGERERRSRGGFHLFGEAWQGGGVPEEEHAEPHGGLMRAAWRLANSAPMLGDGGRRALGSVARVAPSPVEPHPKTRGERASAEKEGGGRAPLFCLYLAARALAGGLRVFAAAGGVS